MPSDLTTPSSRIAVIAGNLRQFQQEATARGFTLRRADDATGPSGESYRYVSSLHHIVGVQWSGFVLWGLVGNDEAHLVNCLRDRGVKHA